MEKFLYSNTSNKTADYKVWFAFPGSYAFAMSSVGYLWLYSKIEELENLEVERIYVNSETTRFNVKDVNIIAFSVSFDMDFLNIFKMLEKYQIPLKSIDRDDAHPLIFGGGPVLTANPAPFSEFFDFIIVGDGEFLNNKVLDICEKNKDLDKKQLLKLLAKIEGVYVPSISKTVKKVTCELSDVVYTPILSEKSFFKNTFIVEVSRGCANRCGFCLASYLNLPVRFAPFEKIIEALELGLKHTNKIALLGAQITAHPCFDEVCEWIYEKCLLNPEIEVGISSLRADYISPITIKMLVAGQQKTSTIAIEAGSQRLRNVINKNLTEEQILNTLKIAKENGLKGLKCYAMIGLPTETQEDLEELICLAKKMKNFVKGFDISFAFSSFVPKAKTPFQWAGRASIKTLEKRQLFLKKEFHKLGLKTNFSSIKWDYYQTLISRGAKELGDYLIDVYKKGADLGSFKSAYKGKFNPDEIVLRTFDLDEELPWDFIESNPSKEFLEQEYTKLINL